MICAEDEIGVGTSHDGIMVLPADTPVGMPAKEYFGVEDDTLIEVDITPNRADGASHYGVARDLYAYYQAKGIDIALTKPSVEEFKVDGQALPIEVVVENAQACPRYTGVSIKGVTIKESPDWLKKARLIAHSHPAQYREVPGLQGDALVQHQHPRTQTLHNVVAQFLPFHV